MAVARVSRCGGMKARRSDTTWLKVEEESMNGPHVDRKACWAEVVCWAEWVNVGRVAAGLARLEQASDENEFGPVSVGKERKRSGPQGRFGPELKIEDFGLYK
jgi:hypothetical protein